MRARTVNEGGMVSASGRGGTMSTPESQRKFAKSKIDQELQDELEEEQVHPDDKIGNTMLKKTGTPSYFESDPEKQTVSQKKT